MFFTINIVLFITILVFSIGLLGIFFNRKNILMILISIEILVLAININFSIFSIYLDDVVGHLFVLFILTIAAAESVIGLSLIIAIYKIKGSIEIQSIKENLINKIINVTI